jgi:hypothetical protein
MAKRHLMGYRHKTSEPVEWALRHDRRVVFYRIENSETALTPDGNMFLVSIIHKAELADPDNDIAALVGNIVVNRKSGMQDPQAPELWYWNDAFWVKARANDGTPYYNNKKYLIYQIQVKDPDKLMEQIKTGYDEEE